MIWSLSYNISAKHFGQGCYVNITRLAKAWFSLTSDASANANTSASNRDQWPKWKRNSTQTQAQASSEPTKLFRREVIWIQCFHWPNITRCGKYPSACVMPERYFVFNANASTSAVTRKRKISILMLLLMPSSRPFSRWTKNYCVYVCARVASEPCLNPITVLLLEIGRFAPGPSAPSCIISWMKTPQQFR